VVLVDTSVWIDFLQGKQPAQPLTQLLLKSEVLCHPWILGELIMGSLPSRRAQILAEIEILPRLPEFSLDAIRDFVEKESLFNKGLSYVDGQLLYSSLLHNCLLWTHDKALCRAAERFGIGMG